MADAAAAWLQIAAKATNAIATNIAFLGNSAPTNADVVAQVRVLTRECTALTRIVLAVFDTVDGT